MKRNRKGFSLVELIVVLVIMAIIAALCAPNISAYVQAQRFRIIRLWRIIWQTNYRLSCPRAGTGTGTRCSGMRMAFCVQMPEDT